MFEKYRQFIILIIAITHGETISVLEGFQTFTTKEKHSLHKYDSCTLTLA